MVEAALDQTFLRQKILIVIKLHSPRYKMALDQVGVIVIVYPVPRVAVVDKYNFHILPFRKRCCL
jgi:hypothetical protein